MQTDKEAFWEIAKGGLAALLVLGVFFTFVATLGTFGGSSEERFKVIDQYNSCNVVRYTPDGSARYAYFLDCGQR